MFYFTQPTNQKKKIKKNFKVRNISTVVFPKNHMMHHVSLTFDKMADNVLAEIPLAIFLLSLFLPGVEAFDAGDAIALVLGLIIGVLGICACLGYYARRRSM